MPGRGYICVVLLCHFLQVVCEDGEGSERTSPHDSLDSFRICAFYKYTGRYDMLCQENLVDLIAQLPAETVSLDLFLGEKTNLGAVNFSNLSSLESLHLYSDGNSEIVILPDQQRVFWPLKNLRELNIHVMWLLKFPLPELLNGCERLEVLDLSDTLHLDFGYLLDILKGLKMSTLRVVKLRNSHIVPESYLAENSQQPPLCSVLRNCPLKQLDISQTGIAGDFSGCITNWPMLIRLNVSNNQLILGIAFFLEVMQHPSLFDVDLGNQCIESIRERILKKPTAFEWIQRETKRYREEGGPLDLMFHLTHHSRGEEHLLISSTFFPAASVILNPSCAHGYALPFTGSIRRLYMRKIENPYLLMLLTRPNECFDHHNSLTFMDLSNNDLKNFTINIRNLRKLSFLDLSENKISTFSHDVMNELSLQAAGLQDPPLRIDLSNNPLLCTCAVKDFTNWVLDRPENISFVKFEEYSCLNEDSAQVLFHKLSKRSVFDCLDKNTYLGLGIVGGLSMAAVLLIVGLKVYQRRWWIRYSIYIARNAWSRHGREEEARRDYRWDVFVCYNNHDKFWVEETLQPKLEDERGIKLCLHERDFKAGRYITELILESIENSRKTLLILSPDFVKSNWCTFEMQNAQQKVFTHGKDVLLLAILRPLNNVQLSKTLTALLQEKTYLEWTEDEYGQKLFWAKLIAALDVPDRVDERREQSDVSGDVGREESDVSGNVGREE